MYLKLISILKVVTHFSSTLKCFWKEKCFSVTEIICLLNVPFKKSPIYEMFYIWNVISMNLWNILSLKCSVYKYPVYEMSCLWNVLSMKCPIYEMSCLWNVLSMKCHICVMSCLWNFLSMKCHICVMSYLLNVLYMIVLSMKCPVY